MAEGINYKRITEHMLFWLAALLMLTFMFGASKPNYWWALKDNLFYLPVHMLYFYTVAYWAMPYLLLHKKYVLFGLLAIFCVLTSALVTRIVDILIIDPPVYLEYRKTHPNYIWPKLQGTFTEQLFVMSYYANAVKGINLVIWVALTLKFFKMWHERREAALEAELNFLKGQVHPHFLFNTLNNLYALSLNKSDRAPGVVMGLSEILKYMLYETKTPTISLSREVETLQNYIALEKIRYEERIDLSIKIQEDLDDYQIAPLLLLPLVENAFKHGTSERVGDVWIKLDLAVKNNTMKLKLSNSKPESLPGDIERHKGNLGLPNVKKRLELLYPNAYDLKIFEDDDDMFVLILEIRLDKHIQI
jgi:LytS/YehU family sensor histidine kinase